MNHAVQWFETLPQLGRWLVAASLQASVLTLLVIVIHVVLGRWLTARWRYALWGVVLLRLIVPVAPAAPWSLFAMLPDQSAPAAGVPVTNVSSRVPPLTQVGALVSDGQAFGLAPSMESMPLRGTYLFLAVWLAGAVLFVLWVVLTNVRLVLRVRRSRQESPEHLLAILARACRDMGVTRELRLVVLSEMGSPALMGVVRPVILVPARLLHVLDAEQLRFVLMHELAHVKRQDIAANWLLILLQAAHWFNPFVWLAFHRLRADREPLCDAMVLRRSADSRQHRAYGQALLQVVEELTRPRLANPALAGISESHSQLRRRIRLIADFGRGRHTPILGVVIVVAIAAIGLTDPTSPVTPSPAAHPEPSEQPESVAPSRDGTAPAPPTAEELANRDVARKLDKACPAVFEANRLSNVLDYIRTVAGVDMLVNWKVLETIGVEPQTPVTLQLQNATVRQVLDAVLNQVSEASGLNAPAWSVVDAVLRVSTFQELRGASELRVYDIRDLLFVLPGVGGPEPTRGEILEQVITVIQDTVGFPAEWAALGGNLSHIRELHGNLIIRTSPENHRNIVHILTSVREARGMQVSTEASFLIVDEAALGDLGIDLKAFDKSPPGSSPVLHLDDRETNLILKAVAGHRASTSISVPRTTAFSGQRAEVTVLRKVAFDGQPQIAAVEEGGTLQVTANVSADRRSVTADIKARVQNIVEEPLPKEARPSATGGGLLRKVPRVETLEGRAVVVAMPDRTSLLVDLGTIHGPFKISEDDRDDTPSTTRRRVLLLLRPTIVIQSDQGRLFPGLVTPRVADEQSP